ncbi:3-oxoacyl-[acyl-carrier protein] reductase [Geomicrobium sp. JCM 19037]|uniref:SDR family NAD(P)-dependent oxidoreductase n=1 Tax=Geomicrobium sp. JCM 19037 TaxID=1460634 RepID=UPI00045F2659|nr:SDR family NAD(P)-dependent oxidoreductase [Geomicrobium sp. JCM 19037]GAK03750.1 3-oxoacyl-[acyl-carrier protein] reductase [Geomicrobium sp. JCM 19037]
MERVALITGAGGPMGRAISKRFFDEKVNVVLTDISEKRLDQTVEALGEDANQILAIRGNMLDLYDVKRVTEAAYEHFGHIDILINVVGGIRAKKMDESILDMNYKRWTETFDLNVKGSVLAIQQVVPQMLERKHGKIVNISSINFAGEAMFADYGAAKAAVASFTKTAAIEFSPYINVNCIAPALIETSVLDRMDEKMLNKYRERTLLKRFGKAEDIANAAYFLASDQADYITGEILSVSGGVTPHL